MSDSGDGQWQSSTTHSTKNFAEMGNSLESTNDNV